MTKHGNKRPIHVHSVVNCTRAPVWLCFVIQHKNMHAHTYENAMYHGLQSVQLNFLSAIKKTIFESKGEEKEEEDGKMHTPRSIY